MKVSVATVRLVLKRNRPNAEGEYPVYLVVCYHGRVEKATGVFVRESNWNERSMTVKAKAPSSLVVNRTLRDILTKALDRRDFLEGSGQSYTAKDVTHDEAPRNRTDFKVLYEELCHERDLRHSTCVAYKNVYNSLSRFLGRKSFSVMDLTEGTLKRWIKANGVSEGTNFIRLGKVASVIHYAIAEGLMPIGDDPFLRWKYSQKLNRPRRDYALDAYNVSLLKKYFMDTYVRDGHVIAEKKRLLHSRPKRDFSLCLFLASYMLYGTAPVDMALLKEENVRHMMVDGVDCWFIDILRRKTGRPVRIRLKEDTWVRVLFLDFLDEAKSRGGYIYPILDGSVREAKVVDTVSTRMQTVNDNLKKYLRDINSITILRNRLDGTSHPVIEVDKCSMYTARHSFATNYLKRPGASLEVLSSLMGRCAETIGVYVHQLTADQEILDATEGLM